MRKWSEDQEKLVEDAQAQILLADGIFYTLLGPQQVQLTCSLTRSFPISSLLARLAGIPMSLGDSNSNPRDETATNPTLKVPNQPPPPTLAKLCDLIDQWPPLQRLTAQGAMAVYSMLQSLGSLLDEFQIKWWMSSGALLGTLRNGGMLPQDCDVDIAIWRPDAHEMLSPKFQAALAAAGLVSFHMPIYFQYRCCFWFQKSLGVSCFKPSHPCKMVVRRLMNLRETSLLTPYIFFRHIVNPSPSFEW